MMPGGWLLALVGVAATLFLWIQRSMTTTPTKTTSTTSALRTSAVKQGRGVKLLQASTSATGTEGTHCAPETDTSIDIIAIHGLDTNSPRTWEFKKEDGQRVNWLADKHMLPAEVPGTRIFTCDWPAEGLETKDSVSLRIEELALSLLQGILGSNLERKRPILFIASCLGGIILMQALVEAKDEYACIREATRGVIFLATPFRGTSFQDSAIWAQPVLRIKALVMGKKVSKLLGWLNEPTFDLTRLVGQFTRLCKGHDREGFEVFTFYETGNTYLPARLPFLSFLLPGSRKPLVDMSSATLDSVPNPLPLHRSHSKMNKFCGPIDSDPDYKSVVEVIQRFLLTIQTGTPLEQADAWIREKHYDKQRLKIERLSGDPLEMSQCYINLALVEIRKVVNSKSMSDGPSPFSLTERLKLEAPHDDLRVELPNLFQPRKAPDGNIKIPRRILIRGRAGVGKTTLCKKIVYDFIHGGMWKDLFKRVIWITLRELKRLPNDNYKLDKVLKNIFFRQQSQHTFLPDQICDKLCTELWRQIEDTQSRDTLFLLDGLDEVPELTMEYKHGNPHPGQELLNGLLNRPNVIITTRPHAIFPTDFQEPDLEFDTMGFSQAQVQTYMEAVIPEDKDTIREYLGKHRIMQSLVQIPIQLDALCFTWQASSIWNTIIPETMTAVYDAMVRELWRKDNERLEKDGIQIIGKASPAETDPFDSTQYENLGYLAFSGLCSNVIEFQPHHRNALYRSMKKERTSLSFDETFARLSFWRTSDPSNTLPNQSFHFIHLTFQEYFSAKHFAKAWRHDQDLEYVEFEGKRPKKQRVSCRRFLGKHKFATRYSIMWRFVAGLLDEDEAQACRLFEAIERESVDMLGPTTQRLVMHCLAEVTQSVNLRTRLEDQLSRWLEFELNFRETSHFVCEAEFPARAITLVFDRASEENKLAIFRSFELCHILPLRTVEFITGCLEMREFSKPLRVAALKALVDEPLPIRTFNVVILLMDSEDEDIRNVSVKILRSQAPWSGDVLRAVMTRLESQESDQHSGIKQRTARALGEHSTLPVSLLRRMASWMKDQDPCTTKAVLKTLGNQCKLDKDIIWSIAANLEDQQEDIRVLAFQTLQERKELTLDILDNMAIYLGAEGINAAEKSILWYPDSRLPDNMLQAINRSLGSQDTNIQQKAWKLLYRERKKWPDMPFDDLFHILVQWLEGGDTELRRTALTLLDSESEFPKTMVNAVRAQLQEDQDPDIFHLAFKILLQKTSCAAVMYKTLDWLKDGDQFKKRLTLQFLGSKDALPRGVLKAIVKQLEDQDGSIRETTLQTLGTLGSREVFPNYILSAISKQIYHTDKTTRRAAVKALAQIWDRQGSPLELLEDIVGELKSHDTAIRKASLDGLAVLGGQHFFLDGTFDAIAIHLADPEEEIRYTAAVTLQKLSYVQVLPDHIFQAMVALVEDPASEIRCVLAMALRTLAVRPIFPDHFLQLLASLLQDPDDRIRRESLETLKRLGRREKFPPDIVDAITNHLEDPQMQNRHLAFEALVDQPCLPEETLQAMVVYGLKGRNPGIRRAALCLIRRLPKMAEEIYRLVVAMLSDEFEEVRQEAVEALASHGGVSDDTYPAVARLLESERPGTRQGVLESLGTSSALPCEILQAVTRWVNDRDGKVQRAAVKALGAQHELPDIIFKSAVLYSVWLGISFKEDVYCSIREGVSYLEWPAGFGEVPLCGQPDELSEVVRERQIELGMLMTSTDIDRR